MLIQLCEVCHLINVLENTVEIMNIHILEWETGIGNGLMHLTAHNIDFFYT